MNEKKLYVITKKLGNHICLTYHDGYLAHSAYFSCYADLLVALLNHIFFFERIKKFGIKIHLPLESSDRIAIEEYVNDIFIHSGTNYGLKRATPIVCYTALSYADESLRLVDCYIENFIDDDSYFEIANIKTDKSIFELLEQEFKTKYKLKDTQARACAILKSAELNKIKIKPVQQYSFDSTKSLFLWLVGAVARELEKRRGHSISICPMCMHYHHATRNSNKYCSISCRRAASKKNSFHGEQEISRVRLCINTLWESKEEHFKDGKRYVYITNDNNAQVYNVTSGKEEYNEQNTAMKEKFDDAYKDFQKNPCQETKEIYHQERDSYLNWLYEQHAFVKSIKQNI